MAQKHMALAGKSTDSETIREFLAASHGNSQGVHVGFRNGLEVFQRSAGANMSIDVETGAAIVGDGNNCAFYSNTVRENLVIASNSSGNDRIDRIVVELDLTLGVGANTCELKVVQGTPAGSPSAPTLTQTATKYQLSLAQVAVADGASSIVDANITDERTYVRDQNVPPQSKVVASDETRSNTTLANSSDFSFAVGASKTYKIRMALVVDCESANDFKFHFTGPSGATWDGIVWSENGGSNVIGDFTESAAVTISTDGGVQVIGVEISLVVSSTAGTMQFQWALASGSTTGTLYAGSWLEYKDLN